METENISALALAINDLTAEVSRSANALERMEELERLAHEDRQKLITLTEQGEAKRNEAIELTRREFQAAIAKIGK